MKRSIIFIIYLFVIMLNTACSSEQFISSADNSSANSHLTSITSSVYASSNLDELRPQPIQDDLYPPIIKQWSDIPGYENVERKDIESTVDVIEIQGIGKDAMPVVTNETPFYEIMSEISPFAVIEIVENCTNYNFVPSYHISNVMDRFSISFLRKTGAGQYYTINKVTGGGYAYIFFERQKDSVDNSYINNDETDVYITGGIYVEKILNYEDFLPIKINDPIQKVVAIDHATSLTKQFSEVIDKIYPNETSREYISNHLLTDGILSIRYKYSSPGNLVVSEMNYFSDSIFKLSKPLDGNSNYSRYYGILPQDYPPET